MKKKQILKIANNYDSYSGFRKNEPRAYRAALKLGIVDRLSLERNLKPRGYWTFEQCKATAKQFKTKADFRRGASAAYVISTRNNWLKDICTHMSPGAGSNGLRQIYAFEFEDGFAYVGLTKDAKTRFSWHVKYKSKKEFSEKK